MIDIKLTSKPISEPISFNAYYKLVQLLAILHYCARSQKAPLSIIHLVFWSFRSKENHEVLRAFAKQERNSLVPWSFEPGIDKVVALAITEGYCERKIASGRLELHITPKGEDVIGRLSESHLFVDLTEGLKEIGLITKGRVDAANANWKLL